MDLFDRFHAAFEESPPRGAFERLQRELIEHSPARRAARPAFRMRFGRMGLRVAAAVAVVVIAIALVAAYIAAQHPAVGGVPAGSSVADYQSSVSRDYSDWNGPFNCRAVADASCPTELSQGRVVLTKWLSDLQSFNTPRQFTVIDKQMRHHISDLIQKLDAASTAVVTKNKALFDDSTYFALLDNAWLAHATLGISRSHLATSGQYTDLVTAEHANFVTDCSSCQQDALLADCDTLDNPLCPHDVTTDSDFIGILQADFVATVAPVEFSVRNAALQSDLAQADDALIVMNNALLQGDPVALKTGRASYLDALVAVEADLQS